MQANKPIYPFLNFRDRLTQIWINPLTIFLILLSLKLFFFQFSLIHSLKIVQSSTISSCNILNQYSQQIASTPRLLAQTANSFVEVGVEKTNQAITKSIQLILKGLKEILIFYIELMLGTYVCLLTSAIDSSVDIATNTTEAVIGWVNDTLIETIDGIEDGLNDLSKIINEAEKVSSSVLDLFDDDSHSFSSVNLTINGLRNLQIPSSINDDLNKLSQNTPDFDTVKNKTTAIIKKSFDHIINKLDNNNYFTSTSSLKLPATGNATICPSNDEIQRKFSKVFDKIDISFKVILILVIITAFLIVIPLSYLEYRKWQNVKIMIKDLELENDNFKIFEIINNNYNKLPIFLTDLISKKISVETVNLQWLLSYTLTPSSIKMLSLGMMGLLMCLFQYIILILAMKSVNGMIQDISISDFTTDVSKNIDQLTNNTNDYLSTQEKFINQGVLGVVSNTTSSLNVTISTFYNDLNYDLKKIFNNTLLEKPILSVVKCVIGNKIESIEKGLVWIHDNSQISLPRVNNTMFAYNVTDIEDNGTVEELLNDIFKTFRKSIKLELIISLILLSTFFLQVVLGLLVLYLKKGVLWTDDFDQGSKIKLSNSSLTISIPPPVFFPTSSTLSSSTSRNKTLYKGTIRNPFKEHSFNNTTTINDDDEIIEYVKTPTMRDVNEKGFDLIDPPITKYRKVSL